MARNYVVEKVFKHNGLTCVVAMMSLGHRCGYVGVPKGHSLYGKDYTDIYEKIDCHGGLTYSSDFKFYDEEGFTTYPTKEKNNLWWFGWDYAHYGDGIDFESVIENFGLEKANEMLKYRNLEGYPYSLDKVEADCKEVAEQLQEEQTWLQ